MNVIKKEKKLYIQAFREIRSYIIRNGLRPGDLLPTEHEMSEKLGVSRNVLREAIKSMELMGMKYPADEARLHDSIGVVLQERLYEDYMTLQENAAYYGRFYSNYDEAYLLEMLKAYDLDPKRKYKGLSKGEELKFQFACALAHHPKFLILDEPTGNFDPEFRDEFLGALKNFIADGEHTVILATHLTDDLDKIADYIIYMENGEITDIETSGCRRAIVSIKKQLNKM